MWLVSLHTASLHAFLRDYDKEAAKKIALRKEAKYQSQLQATRDQLMQRDMDAAWILVRASWFSIKSTGKFTGKIITNPAKACVDLLTFNSEDIIGLIGFLALVGFTISAIKNYLNKKTNTIVIEKPYYYRDSKTQVNYIFL